MHKPAVDIAPDMITLVSGHQDGAIRFWDFLRSPTCVHSVTQHTAHVTHVQFSPRNHYEILTSSKDNSLKIIDTRTYTASQVCYFTFLPTIENYLFIAVRW